MNKYNFKYDKEDEEYQTIVDGIEISINEDDYNEETAKRAIDIVKAYSERLEELANFCVESDTFKYCYPEFSKQEVIDRLHLPKLHLDKIGGMFTYCNHELDEDHLIDI